MTIICVRLIEKSDLSNPTYPTYPINLTWNKIQIQPNQLCPTYREVRLIRSPTYRELTVFVNNNIHLI